MIAEVLVEINFNSKEQTFSYLIPSFINVSIGSRVLVPFGNRKLEGFVLDIHENNNTSTNLKTIENILDENPVLTSELIELGKYMSKKTISSLISCYQAMLPKALKAKAKVKINKKLIKFIKLNIDYNEALNNAKNDKQKEIINSLKNGEKKLTDISCINSSYKTLLNNGILKEILEEEYRIKNNTSVTKSNIILNDEQKNAVSSILLDKFKPYLLFGVTGSGKTEVYMHVIKKVIDLGREVIVLVPEISLTPQLINNFRERFGDNIAVLHSGLSDGEKYDEWRKIERQEVKIVIGARSAIFAPFTNLGLIVMDEEHVSTYKQENNPKYSTHDMAIFRAKYNNIPVIFGSATPSIESYTRAINSVYKLIELKKRINNSLPNVEIIDMKDEYKHGNKIISSSLKEKLESIIEKKEQAIILLNRRGFSTITTCKNCGYVHKCKNCDIPLTYHKSSNSYKCHYCGYTTSNLSVCPVCKSDDLDNMGLGTEKLEEYINKNIKGAKVIRMDVDTTSRKGSHERIINSFKNGDANILLGTQMIAKGLDFPNVTLVGVINADATLNVPDFRSSERTFQLLNQVSGRSGRAALKGNVVIQAFNTDHYSIVLASKNRYLDFYEKEISYRKKLLYPPYCNLALIKISSRYENEVINESNKIVKYLNSVKAKDVIILGPSAPSMYKINNTFNMQIILKYKKTENIYNHLLYIKNLYDNKKIKVEIDINPIKI